MYIDTLIREKDLNLKMFKVKGHSEDAYNELADDYAKQEGCCDDILDVAFILSNSKIKFFPHFKKIPIAQKIRKFTTTTLRAFTCAESTCFQFQKSNFSNYQISWKSFWILFNNLIRFWYNQKKKHASI